MNNIAVRFLKDCVKCERNLPTESFHSVKSLFFKDKLAPICMSCVEQIVAAAHKKGDLWTYVEKICALYDIPFIIEEWEKVFKTNGNKAMNVYSAKFRTKSVSEIDWQTNYKKYLFKDKNGQMEEELPGYKEAELKRLQKVWGENYAEEQIIYLENLFNGILKTQPVVGALQLDGVRKVCKISLSIDEYVREGGGRADKEFNSLLTSYDRLMKATGLNPENAKSMSDIESVGELFGWLEKRGWKNQYYTGESKDIVDETIKNMQAWTRRLYTNESSIPEEIAARIEGLKRLEEMKQEDSMYNPNFSSDELEEYSWDGEEELSKEFEVEV